MADRETKTEKSLYADCLALALRIDNHESDLYIEDTPSARKLVAFHGYAVKPFVSKRPGPSAEPFKTGGESWLDVPFAYLPFWSGKKVNE